MNRRGARIGAALAAAGLLSACASQPKSTPGYSRAERKPAASRAVLTASGAKVGAPYQIDGIWYYPKEDPHYDKVGVASWYGVPFDGRPTATGEIYDMNGLTAAHTTLPLPTNVEVTNLENGRSLVLRVNDRGPFVGSRVIDVSRRAAQLLGFEIQGTAKVRVRALPDAGSNTMLASAATPAIDTRANVAPMPGGNTQLLAQSDARMAPVANPAPAPAVAAAAMAPIADPVVPAAAPMVVARNLAPLPTAPARSQPVAAPAPAYAAARQEPAVEERSLAAILPPATPAYAAPAYAAPAYAAAPAPRAVASASDYAAPRRPALRFVKGPAPAEIRSDARLVGYAPSAGQSASVIRPTLASAVMSDEPLGQRVEQALGSAEQGRALYIQAGAFVDNGNAEALRTQLRGFGQTDILTTSIGGRTFHRVRIGPLAGADQADLALAKLRQMGHPGARIVSQ